MLEEPIKCVSIASEGNNKKIGKLLKLINEASIASECNKKLVMLIRIS
jgi:hypothetical protein